MDGIKSQGISLFLTKIPNRKGLSFCFEKEGVLYPVSYVPKKYENLAVEMWKKMFLLQ